MSEVRSQIGIQGFDNLIGKVSKQCEEVTGSTPVQADKRRGGTSLNNITYKSLT